MTITWEKLLAIAGGLVVLFNAGKAIVGMFVGMTNPQKELKKRVDRHGELLEKDNQRLEKEEACTAATMSAILALLDHAITGNSVEKLKAARENLQTHLIGR